MTSRKIENINKVVLFSANTDGGILQFLMQIMSECLILGKKVRAYIPKGARVNIPSEAESLVFFYKKKKSIFISNKMSRFIACNILQEKTDVVWFMDNSIVSGQVILELKNKVTTMITIHDAGGYHPQNSYSLLNHAKRIYGKRITEKACKKTSYILLLSEESKKKFLSLRPNYMSKVLCMNLCAHIPDVHPEKPEELVYKNEYFLFFGRIDKYKGIGNLLDAYSEVDGKAKPLVIAGKGSFTDSERKKLSLLKNVCLINRYITDQEMVYLFRNAVALVLPYIEATQSGIIPISYKLGKPVITSSELGLTQFVDDGKTGIVCYSTIEYAKALKYLSCITSDEYGELCSNAEKYYHDKLSLNKTLLILLRDMQK